MITDGNQGVWQSGPENTQGVGAFHPLKSPADRGNQIIRDSRRRRSGSRRCPRQILFNKMGQDFGIGLRAETMPLCDKLFTQGVIIFDDPIVHHHQIAAAITVRMGVFGRRRAMGRPAGMAKTNVRWGDNGLINNRLQGRQLASGPVFDQFSILEINNPRRIISAIFKAAQAFKHYRHNSPGSDIPDDSTHNSPRFTDNNRQTAVPAIPAISPNHTI